MNSEMETISKVIKNSTDLSIQVHSAATTHHPSKYLLTMEDISSRKAEVIKGLISDIDPDDILMDLEVVRILSFYHIFTRSEGYICTIQIHDDLVHYPPRIITEEEYNRRYNG